MPEKLTALQQETIDLIRSGKVTKINCGTGAWRIHGASPNAVGKLLQKKLITEKKIDDKTYLFELV